MRPYFPIDSIQIPLGKCARRTVGKKHISGTWVVTYHVVNGRVRYSVYLVDPVWDTSSAIIYRCRKGNGYYGSELGKLYQDQYDYFIPSSINNPQGETAREAFAQAVYNWQNILTDNQKQVYYDRVSREGLKMSGYNLYISEYVRDNA